MSELHPLISCICVTNGRPVLLKRAVDCFLAQDYPNKQLVISYPNGDLLTHSLINDLKGVPNLNVLMVERSGEETVGNARNGAIRKCDGSYVCVWDDDDWYHPSRLSYQFYCLDPVQNGLNASVLNRIILFDAIADMAYISFSYCWENTLLCKKEIALQNQYADSNKGEDTHIIKFLSGKKFLYSIHDAPYLYIYVYHGQNTWDYKHYRYLIEKSELLNRKSTAQIREIFRN